ncbi:hypothetical protein KIN20_015417 [Parelaphostrongylus tenuis]|uniref:Uncharacterized protein n=1 Tax=Parelaphostrongylus tenuis TaxID=148309 RepID=A0AAD5MIG7_PARTN|nr:hypothetical protein KIN20_015417 [Parelaphostrongylus tenuis]
MGHRLLSLVKEFWLNILDETKRRFLVETCRYNYKIMSFPPIMILHTAMLFRSEILHLTGAPPNNANLVEDNRIESLGPKKRKNINTAPAKLIILGSEKVADFKHK